MGLFAFPFVIIIRQLTGFGRGDSFPFFSQAFFPSEMRLVSEMERNATFEGGEGDGERSCIFHGLVITKPIQPKYALFYRSVIATEFYVQRNEENDERRKNTRV